MTMRFRWWVSPVLLAVWRPRPWRKSGDWTTYGGNDWNQRYSHAQADHHGQNVSRLMPRMIFQTGIAKLGSFENTPIVSNGVMYVTTPYNTAMAYDLNTNKELWRYEHKLGTTIFCCGPNNRGVAIHGGAHVYMGTLDAHLVALDAKDGKVMWDKEVADPAFGYSITHAPLIIGDNVIVGVSGGEYGIRGHVTAYNAVSGEQVWRWYSIPAPKGDPDLRRQGAQRLVGHLGGRDARRRRPAPRHRQGKGRQRASTPTPGRRGGGGVWMTPAYDKEPNTIFLAVGNPSPDLDGSVRPGDNLYTDCVVAIDATNGKTKWYYQTVPHDVWDLDAVVAAGGDHARRQEGRGPRRQDRLGLRARCGHRQAGPPERRTSCRRRTCSRCRRRQGHPDAAGRQRRRGVVADLGRPDARLRLRGGAAPADELHTHTAPWEKGRLWLGSAFVAIPGEEQYGLFSAVDLKTGKIAWQNKVPQPMMGGSLATAGGLTFTGEGNGNFNAYDSKSGKLLWQFNAGAGCNSAPMTFTHGGEQFVAVACGGNFQISYPLGDAVMVFGLPKKK